METSPTGLSEAGGFAKVVRRVDDVDEPDGSEQTEGLRAASGESAEERSDDVDEPDGI